MSVGETPYSVLCSQTAEQPVPAALFGSSQVLEHAPLVPAKCEMSQALLPYSSVRLQELSGKLEPTAFKPLRIGQPLNGFQPSHAGKGFGRRKPERIVPLGNVKPSYLPGFD